jgi:hypothetical protein
MRTFVRLLPVLLALAPVEAAIFVPATGIPLFPASGTGLFGQMWLNLGTGAPDQADWMNLAEAAAALDIENTAPEVTFTAATIDYGSSSFDSVETWLGADGASAAPPLFTPLAVRAMYVRLTGFLAIPAPLVNTEIEFVVRTDDGFRLIIGGLNIVEFDAQRGEDASTERVVFEGEGLYPIQLDYFNSLDSGAALRLFWDPGVDGTSELIPASSLYAVPEPGMWIPLAGALAAMAIRKRR